MTFKEITISSNEIYNGRILNLRKDDIELPDGRNSIREIVEHSGGVTVIPITDEGKIVLVKQYRKPAEEVLMELPAGKLEPDEKPEICAARELEEETGYRPDTVEKVFSFYTSPGYSDEIITMFRAEGLTLSTRNLDADEFIEINEIEKQDIMPLIKNGIIKDSKTLIGLLWYLRGEE